MLVRLHWGCLVAAAANQTVLRLHTKATPQINTATYHFQLFQYHCLWYENHASVIASESEHVLQTDSTKLNLSQTGNDQTCSPFSNERFNGVRICQPSSKLSDCRTWLPSDFRKLGWFWGCSCQPISHVTNDALWLSTMPQKEGVCSLNRYRLSSDPQIAVLKQQDQDWNEALRSSASENRWFLHCQTPRRERQSKNLSLHNQGVCMFARTMTPWFLCLKCNKQCLMEQPSCLAAGIHYLF